MEDQQMIRAAYLKPQGTFGWLAAMNMMDRQGAPYSLVPMGPQVMIPRNVAQEKVDMGCVAYYNYLEGLVEQMLDSVYESGLWIKDAERLTIEYCLVGLQGGGLTGPVYSHQKAIDQCAGYMYEKYGISDLRAVDSTAEGLIKIRQPDGGMALVGEQALADLTGLEVIERGVAAQRHGKRNYTDFLLLSKHNGCEYDPSQKYITIVAVTPYVIDQPGLMCKMSGQAEYYEINMHDLHSRPAIDDVRLSGSPKMFYFEMQAHPSEDRFVELVRSLRWKLKPRDGGPGDPVRIMGTFKDPSASWNDVTGYTTKLT